MPLMNTTEQILPKVKYTIAVSSGKGGVGKSTVAVNLAAALIKEGYKTGLIDADIYGPSIPTMLDAVNERPKLVKINDKNRLLPVVRYGIKMMSIGFLVDPNEAVVWRGPMASSALKQFMGDVEWDELDFLLYDMPPGTGDIQLTLTQSIPLTGAVIVTTPQEISLIDARKGAKMFEKVNVPVLGIIENMSYYTNSDGSKEYIFGKGGGKKLADELKINFLGEIAVNTAIRLGGDEGKPIVLRNPDSVEAGQFTEIAKNMAEDIINKAKLHPKLPVIEI
ncbi:MAG: Chromosome-partitioning ATPase protein [Chlorobi bacterium OLB5]|nr:MAG: Chromosome-partitioning ATPase protein [Chlorobi bacterium OLB5]